MHHYRLRAATAPRFRLPRNVAFKRVADRHRPGGRLLRSKSFHPDVQGPHGHETQSIPGRPSSGLIRYKSVRVVQDAPGCERLGSGMRKSFFRFVNALAVAVALLLTAALAHTPPG